MTLDMPALMPPMAEPDDDGDDEAPSAAVETLMCERSGSIANPSTSTLATPTIDPTRCLRTLSVLSSGRFRVPDVNNEDIIKTCKRF